MICYYLNSRKEKIDLMKYPYRLITGNFYSYEWEEITYGSRIYGFCRQFFEKELQLDVFCKKSEFAEAMNRLEDVIAYDRMNMKPGKLYVNGEYLSCFVKAVKKDEWEAGIYTIVTLTIISDKPYWIDEEAKIFYSKNVGDTGEGYHLNYPFDYPFNYTVSGIGTEQWYIDHIGSCNFKMIIYGPVTNPRILINGYPYEVYTTLEDGEYLILDTRDHTIVKYILNGTTSNLYDNRRMEQSVFDPIGPELLNITWSGTFGFDITVFIERSEPRWKISS